MNKNWQKDLEFFEVGAQLREKIREKGLSIGFDWVGFTSASPNLTHSHYSAWLENGFAGEMQYLQKHSAQKNFL
jgi:epoxyqueuosine reductase